MYMYINTNDTNIYNLFMCSHMYHVFKDLSQTLGSVHYNYSYAASWNKKNPSKLSFSERPETRLKVSPKPKYLDKTGLKDSICFYFLRINL